jgi:hypothetical protein
MAAELERTVAVAQGRRLACSPLTRRERPQDCCFTPVDEPRRPDPAIYSQLEILQRGLAIPLSWNSPDINSNSQPGTLSPAGADIVVRNLSTVASAANVRVDVSLHRFGIGFPRELIGGNLLSIGPGAQTVFTVPYPQPVVAGEQRVGVEVRITHPTDADMGNNVGFQAIDWLATSDVGKSFTVDFPVRNPSPGAQAIQIQAGPVDAGLTVTPPPSGPAFGPFEERVLTAQIVVAPDVTTFQRSVTFMAFDAAGELLGGVAFVINVDS